MFCNIGHLGFPSRNCFLDKEEIGLTKKIELGDESSCRDICKCLLGNL